MSLKGHAVHLLILFPSIQVLYNFSDTYFYNLCVVKKKYDESCNGSPNIRLKLKNAVSTHI